jgi:hypothetical protein
LVRYSLNYFPFDGELFPLEDLDYDIHQQYWLPLFAGLTWVYTILGVMGLGCYGEREVQPRGVGSCWRP